MNFSINRTECVIVKMRILKVKLTFIEQSKLKYYKLL